MTRLYRRIKNELGLSYDINQLIPSSSGWYTIQHKGDLGSTRYSLAVKKIGFKYIILLYDRKTEQTIKIDWKENPKLNLLDNEDDSIPKDTRLTLIKDLYKNNKFKDNGYLEAKGLLSFDRFNIVKINYYSKLNYLLVPYTNFDIYPDFCGAKLIGPQGQKESIKGSSMKGAFHAHRYKPSIMAYIIGEGYPECCIAANLLPNFNVLEAGGIGNIKNILNLLLLNPENMIYLLGENDSIEQYNTLQTLFPTIKISYPPTKDTKDFGDYYLKVGADKTKEALLGLLLEQGQFGYRPLGIEDAKPVFYSKLINDIVKQSPDSVDSIFRLMTQQPWKPHNVSPKTKRAAISKLFMECAQCGSYTPDNVLPVGLWPYKKKHYYNDGDKPIIVEDGKLKRATYSDVIQTDFLLHKVPNSCPIDIYSNFTRERELTELITKCDWEEDVYAKILLGFLIQSYYAGSIEFRPHLWIMSDTSHAGKSWLSNWCTQNLVQNAFRRESGRSTSAGTAQAMASLAGLLTADEFAEEGTSYLNDARRMIELLRSASTAQAPVVLGSPEQKPIRGHIKFSALLACIEGEQLLKKQDFDRIIIIKFGKKKGHFERDVLPLFDRFVDEQKNLGFAAHALKGFYNYKKWRKNIHIILSEKYPQIGHKARGLASILAGYAVLHNTDNVIESVLRELEVSSLIKPYIISEDIIKEDIVEQILRTTISEKYTPSGDSSFKSVLNILRSQPDGKIAEMGLVLKSKHRDSKNRVILHIYCNKFRNFVEKELKLNVRNVYHRLERSKYYVKWGTSVFEDIKKTRYFKFDLSEYILGEKEELDLLK